MNTPNSSSEQPEYEQSGVDPVEEAIRSLQAELRDGGPSVDSVLIMSYIDKTLPSEKMAEVQTLIETWQPWSENYRSLSFAQASKRDVDDWFETSDQVRFRKRTTDLLGDR